jgi:cyclic pyranopterin monophosphate synthase
VINTSQKVETLRVARAEAVLRASPEALSALRENRVPKGDALDMARAAGILAGKRTFELIPLCHPLPLDQVDVSFEFIDGAVRVIGEATVTARTGVEMEALMAVSVAALTLYDMLKPIDKSMEITGIRLIEKRGGKSDFKASESGYRAGVIVVSDRVSRCESLDESGLRLKEFLQERAVEVVFERTVPDEGPEIAAAVKAAHAARCDLILTTGGTGLGPRDVTVEAVRPLLEREATGIAEAMRAHGTRRHPYAMLSRGVAGCLGGSLVLTLPGSPAGAVESLAAVFPAVLHARAILAGGGHS